MRYLVFFSSLAALVMSGLVYLETIKLGAKDPVEVTTQDVHVTQEVVEVTTQEVVVEQRHEQVVVEQQQVEVVTQEVDLAPLLAEIQALRDEIKAQEEFLIDLISGACITENG